MKKIPKKKWLILSIFTFVCLILIGYVVNTVNQLEQVVPSQERYSDFVDPHADTLVLFTLGDNQNKEIIFKNKQVIQHFQSLTLDKITTRISAKDEHKLQSKYLLRISYNSDKGRDVIIDDQGRLFVIVSKSEIRNKGREYWLWWRIDSFFDRSVYLYYYTDPDPQIVKITKELLSEIASEHSKAGAGG